MFYRLLLGLAVVSILSGCGMSVGLPRTNGAFIDAVKGRTFEPMDTLDPRNAMVYIYRPASAWGYEEVQAPTLFIDGYQIFGLKSGAWSWIELHGGRYELTARRPLGILFVKTIFRAPLEIEGGKTYYLRYSETRPLVLEELVANPEELIQDGPLQQVPESIALRELKHLRLDEAGIYYGGEAYREPRWAPFWTYPEKGAVPAE